MRVSGQLAFANVRARARLARLCGPEVTAHLAMVHEPAARAAALRKLGGDGDAASLMAARLVRLVDDYLVLGRAYPFGGELIAALGRLHEIENLKLLWRAVVRGAAPASPASSPPSGVVPWRRLWRPLGALATLPLARAEEVRSMADLRALAADSPYGDLVAAAAATPAGDATAELAFDRFGSERLADEARRLPASEVESRRLVEMLVRERDLDVVRRAAAYGLDVTMVAAATVLLGRERGADRLAELAAWTPAHGPLGALLPPALLGRETVAAEWDEVTRALRRRRRHACAVALVGAPLRLAPGVAYLLLAEEELRGLVALAEAAGGATAGALRVALDAALSGSALGDERC